jgi:hypothetical protein
MKQKGAATREGEVYDLEGNVYVYPPYNMTTRLPKIGMFRCKSTSSKGILHEGKGAATWEGKVLDLDRDQSLLVIKPRPDRRVEG